MSALKTAFQFVRQRWKLALLAGFALIALVWLALPKPSLYPEGNVFSRVLEDRNGRIVHIALTPDGKHRVHASLDELGGDLIEATLLQEDRHFRSHPGFNPLSLVRATWGVITRIPRGGGSTITMQYARLRFGLRTRTLVGKLAQIMRALELERHYTKDEILEAYLNLAPYGGNVEGVQAASVLWCGKRAKDLTLRESVALAVLPQSPTRRKPKAGAADASFVDAQSRLMQRVQNERGLRADPLDAQFTLRPEANPPREAPHLSRRLFAADDSTVVASTIDRTKQQTVERALTEFVARKREIGIRNGCALLIHAPSREVLAYAGSAGFLDTEIQGQVDGVTSRRSPGSALKPFVYALAMQQGLIHPRTLLRDGRMAFGSYNPENFDRQFAGPIAAADALYLSRNIPAVALAQRLPEPGLYGFLKQAGVALPYSAAHYGLSLPLGGAEVSMEEIGELYALLADDGCAKPLRFAKNAPPAPVRAPLLTREVCFLTKDMLRPREEEPQFDDREVSWKTGTSHGFRDAWAAGIRGDYVLVVWIGNFNGRASPSFIARECAAPLLFDMFRRLRLPSSRKVAPRKVSEVELCAVSGALPTPQCEHRIHGWFIPGVSPITPCQVHREAFIDGNSGRRLASDDGRAGLRREIYEFWPPDMLELFRKAGLPRREPPPLEPDAHAMLSADTHGAPRITSPRTSLVYTLRANDPARQSIPLRADVTPGVRKVYWFAGQQFLGATAPVEPLMWHAATGEWKLQVLDDHGRIASCELRVEMVE